MNAKLGNHGKSRNCHGKVMQKYFVKYVRILCSNLPFFSGRYDRMLKEVTIALVGKYTKLEDSYTSVVKALNHAAMACDHKLNLKVRSRGNFISVNVKVHTVHSVAHYMQQGSHRD